MEKFKLFIASSSELKGERETIELAISRINTQILPHDIYIEPVKWEDLCLSFNGDRVQDYFTENMLKCHIAVFLFGTKVGQYTHEEFIAAYKSFSQRKKPKFLYVYFKNHEIKSDELNDDIIDVYSLRKQIEKYEQVYNSYSSIENLSYHFEKQLLKASDEIRQELNLDNKIRSIRFDLIDILSPFLRQFSMVIFRFSPIYNDIMRFHRIFEDLGADSKKEEYLSRMKSAFNSVDLDSAATNLKVFLPEYLKLINKAFSFDKNTKNNPSSKFSEYLTVQRIDAETFKLTKAMEQLILEKTDNFNAIHKQYNQLKEFFARYEEILSRNGFIDIFQGAACAFLFGSIGVVGKIVWTAWRNASDEEFVKDYSNAFHAFCNDTHQLAVELEQGIEELLNNFIVKHNELYGKALDEIYSKPNYEAVFNDIYDNIHLENKPDFDNKTKNIIQATLLNLQNNDFSPSKEKKLKKLLGLSDADSD